MFSYYFQEHLVFRTLNLALTNLMLKISNNNSIHVLQNQLLVGQLIEYAHLSRQIRT